MEFNDLIKKRKSIRKYKDQKIERGVLEKIMEAVIQSPTAMNKQERLYTVIQNQETMKDLAQAMGKSLGREAYNFMGAPCLVLVSVPNREIRGIQDSSIALSYLYLAAENEGLGACWINQFKEVDTDEYKAILKDLAIPEDHMVYAGMVLGYKDQDPAIKTKDEEVRYFD